MYIDNPGYGRAACSPTTSATWSPATWSSSPAQVPIKDGEFQYQGKVGAEISVEDAQAAARLCAINIISQLKA